MALPALLPCGPSGILLDGGGPQQQQPLGVQFPPAGSEPGVVLHGGNFLLLCAGQPGAGRPGGHVLRLGHRRRQQLCLPLPGADHLPQRYRHHPHRAERGGQLQLHARPGGAAHSAGNGPLSGGHGPAAHAEGAPALFLEALCPIPGSVPVLFMDVFLYRHRLRRGDFPLHVDHPRKRPGPELLPVCALQLGHASRGLLGPGGGVSGGAVPLG